MIIFKDKEVAILCPTKVGSSSLFEVFTQNPAATVTQLRYTVVELKEYEPELAKGIEDYTFYAFYRDPLERFVSSFNHVLRNDETIDRSITGIDLVRSVGYFAPQVKWLGCRQNISLLDFRNFEANARKLGSRLGITIGEFPVVNASVNGKTVADLSQDEIDYVKELYRKDYEFFASKGILFT